MEVEAVILQHPGVREVGVVGIPVPIYGEVPIAFVVKNPDVWITEKEIIDHVAAEVLIYISIITKLFDIKRIVKLDVLVDVVLCFPVLNSLNITPPPTSKHSIITLYENICVKHS